MFIRTLIMVCLSISFVQAQDLQYVKAENGLTLRDQPNRGSTRLALLDYGTLVEVTEHTNLKLDVMDSGNKINGEWVKVRSVDAYDTFEGYLFNGFLTEDKLEKRFNVKYDAFTVSIENLSEKKPRKDDINREFDGVLFYAFDENESLDGKTIRIKHHKEFRDIKVFQKHENSIAISDDKSHCDIINWQHYYSSWKPLRTISNNKQFKGLPISKKEATRFIDINIDELKQVVNDECGVTWSDSIKEITSLNEYPTSIKVSKQYLRIIMTDINGEKIEKIIIFEVPISNVINKDSYAKL